MRGRGYERILPFADRTRPVHSFRNLVWRMVRQILAESICEQPAAHFFARRAKCSIRSRSSSGIDTVILMPISISMP